MAVLNMDGGVVYLKVENGYCLLCLHEACDSQTSKLDRQKYFSLLVKDRYT